MVKNKLLNTQVNDSTIFVFAQYYCKLIHSMHARLLNFINTKRSKSPELKAKTRRPSNLYGQIVKKNVHDKNLFVFHCKFCVDAFL